MADRFREEWDETRTQIQDAIASNGQWVHIVRPGRSDPPGTHPFMYTIGNHERGLPELLLIGTAHDAFASLLNRLGDIQRQRGTAFADEERVSTGGQFPIRIVDAGAIGRTDYATFVGLYYGAEDYQIRQVVLCDLLGRWPDTPGCDLPYAEQPILSHRRPR